MTEVYPIARPVAVPDTLSIVSGIALTGALVYGINLYFDLNANINDPIVDPLVPLTKDAIFTLLMGCLLFRRRLHLEAQTGLLMAFVGVTSFISFIKFGIHLRTLASSKNLVLYGLGGYLCCQAIVDELGPKRVGIITGVAISISLLVSLVTLALHVQSLDGRLYGTYGNPTSLGFAGVVLLGLSLIYLERLACSVATAAVAILYIMTGSFSVLVAAAILLGAEFFRDRQRFFLLSTVFIAAFAVCGYGLSHLNLPAFGWERVVQIITDPSAALHSQSITIRAADLTADYDGFHRYDAYLMTLWHNYGIASVATYCALVIFSMYKSKSVAIPLLFSLFVFNPLVQHQIGLFPDNLLFVIVLALSTRSVPKSAQ